jgi:hypothetical protein
MCEIKHSKHRNVGKFEEKTSTSLKRAFFYSLAEIIRVMPGRKESKKIAFLLAILQGRGRRKLSIYYYYFLRKEGGKSWNSCLA